MSEINFVELCESVLEESEIKKALLLLEAEIQKESAFQTEVLKIANKVDRFLSEQAFAKKNKRWDANADRRHKMKLWSLRLQFKKLLDQGRQQASLRLTKTDASGKAVQTDSVAFSDKEVDAAVLKQAATGGAYQNFGKLLASQFGTDFFQAIRYPVPDYLK